MHCSQCKRGCVAVERLAAGVARKLGAVPVVAGKQARVVHPDGNPYGMAGCTDKVVQTLKKQLRLVFGEFKCARLPRLKANGALYIGITMIKPQRKRFVATRHGLLPGPVRCVSVEKSQPDGNATGKFSLTPQIYPQKFTLKKKRLTPYGEALKREKLRGEEKS